MYKDTDSPAFGNVYIPPGADLNIDMSLSQTQDVGQRDISRQFSDQVFEDLPDLLKYPCQMLTSREEREVFLLGALGVISGVLPNVKGHYRGKEVESNLYCYILAPYGEGKGALGYSRKLAQTIHQEKREGSKQAEQEHKADLARYEKEMKAFLKNKDDSADPPQKPAPPQNQMLFIPANSSKTGIYQLVAENEGRGIIFESEGDTLADTLKQDYGNFSDGLRKAFHHESISYFRRANCECVEINEPYLSVILSSTFDQLTKPIPTIENGLFSRFLYYELNTTPAFDNVFDRRKNAYSRYFADCGKSFLDIYHTLSKLDNSIWFELQQHQQIIFLSRFQQQKEEVWENVSKDLGGTVNRLGLICFRIAMIFSALRLFETGETPNTFYCSDKDFENALRIVEALKGRALSVYWRLHKAQEESRTEPDTEKLTQKRQCWELHEQGYTYRQIALQLLGSESKKSTVYRWIHE